MRHRIKKLLKSNGGFTLFELIVVIAIMGVLVAMIAPRITGLSAKAKDRADTSNVKMLEDAINHCIADHEVLPPGLTNIMTKSGTAYTWPSGSLYEDATGAGFEKNNLLTTHVLSDDEAKELMKFGVTKIYNWNPGGDMTEEDVKAGVQVAIIGAGASGPAATDEITPVAAAAELNNPEYLYRIVLGVGQESNLVKWKSIDKAPVNSVANAEGKFDNYCIVLPRLFSTIKRLNGVDLETDSMTFKTKVTGTEVAQEKTLRFYDTQYGYSDPTQLGSMGGTPDDMALVSIISPDGSNLKEPGVTWIVQ